MRRGVVAGVWFPCVRTHLPRDARAPDNARGDEGMTNEGKVDPQVARSRAEFERVNLTFVPARAPRWREREGCGVR